MRITVFGAAGNVGSRVVTEALSRGHEVTAVVRDSARFGELHPQARARTGDAARAADVVRLSEGQDLLIAATRPVPGSEGQLLTATQGLLAGAEMAGVRLLIVGGAASLNLPGAGGLTVVDGPDFPAGLRPIALACNEQFAAAQAAPPAVDWTYLSPPAVLEPGVRRGTYRLGTDELIVDADGNSAISMEDFAIALVDEAEHPKHNRARFTVGY